jgi:hypothetical protein
MKAITLYLGLDVHKDSITIAIAWGLPTVAWTSDCIASGYAKKQLTKRALRHFSAPFLAPNGKRRLTISGSPSSTVAPSGDSWLGLPQVGSDWVEFDYSGDTTTHAADISVSFQQPGNRISAA